MTSRIVQPIILLALCIGLTVAVLLNTAVFEAGVRNYAFVTLSKGFLQPTLTSDGYLARSLELFGRASVSDPARYKPYQLRLKGLIETLSKDTFESGAINPLAVSSRPVAHDEWQSAIGSYLSAIAQGPAAVREDAIRELAGLLDSQEELADFGVYMHTDAGASSSVPVAFNKCPEAELMAIYVNEHSVAIGQPVPIAIVWRIETENLQAGAVLDELFQQQNPRWELRRSGRFLFQIGTAINQVPEGGFERIVLPREGLPPSLPRKWYGTQMQQHTQLGYEFPETGRNMVLLLDGQGKSSVSLANLPIDISSNPPREAHLVTGRYRTVGEATPRIGIRWLLKDAQRWEDSISSYLVWRRSDEWTPFAGILPQHLEAESFQYWVINVNSDSQLYVDNLGLFSVPLPCH